MNNTKNTMNNDEINELLQNKQEITTNGQSSKIYTDKDNKYIIKEIQLTNWVTKEDIEKEYNIQTEAYNLGIAPKIYNCIIENTYGYLIMDKIENVESLTSYYKRKNKIDNDKFENTVLNIKNAINKLYEKGIYHLDLHSDNILIKENGEIIIIDYGLSEIYVNDDKLKNTSPKKPYKHKLIEILETNEFIYLNPTNNLISVYGGNIKKNNINKKNKKKKTKNKKTKNHKRKTRKRVKRKQI